MSGKIIVEKLFFENDLLLSTDLIRKGLYYEIVLVGNPCSITKLEPIVMKLRKHTSLLSQKGYYYSSFNKESEGIFSLAFEDIGINLRNQIELIELIFRKDCIRLLNLKMSPNAQLTIRIPKTQPIYFSLPLHEPQNGNIIICHLLCFF